MKDHISAMKKSKEKVIPPIKLKYYRRPKDVKNLEPSGIQCAWCLKKNIINTGGGFKDEKGNAHQICEDCAVLRYKEDHGYKSTKAAGSRRRRIFDVGYLFNEMIIDLYMEENGIKNFESLDNADGIFMKSNELFNLIFSKEDKIVFEETEEQSKIESEFQRRLLTVNLTKFFESIK